MVVADRAGMSPARGKDTVRGTTPRRPSRIRPTGLSTQARTALENYFRNLDGCNPPSGLHELVISEVERPLIELVMERCDHKVTRAAAVLGINRATLSKRLKKYGLVD